VKEWLKSVLNYQSYPKNKTGYPFFGTPCRFWTINISGWCCQRASRIWHSLHFPSERSRFQRLLQTRSSTSNCHSIISIRNTRQRLETISPKSTKNAEDRNIHILCAIVVSSRSRHMDHRHGWRQKTTRQTPARRHSSAWRPPYICWISCQHCIRC